jgi:hypothetical protein
MICEALARARACVRAFGDGRLLLATQYTQDMMECVTSVLLLSTARSAFRTSPLDPSHPSRSSARAATAGERTGIRCGAAGARRAATAEGRFRADGSQPLGETNAWACADGLNTLPMPPARASGGADVIWSDVGDAAGRSPPSLQIGRSTVWFTPRAHAPMVAPSRRSQQVVGTGGRCRTLPIRDVTARLVRKANERSQAAHAPVGGCTSIDPWT